MKEKICLVLSLMFFLSFVPIAFAPEAWYNFTDTTNNKAYKNPSNNDNNQPPLWANGWGGTEVTAAEYTNLQTLDGVGANVTAGGANYEPFMRFNFTLNMTLHSLSSIQWIYLFMRHRSTAGTAGEDCAAAIANFSASAFQRFNATDADAGAGWYNATANFTGGFSLYIDSNNQLVLMSSGDGLDAGASEACDIDFAQVRVGFTSIPTYSSNSTNSTIAGKPVEHRLKWASGSGLSKAITSLWNGSSWVNATSWCSLSGTSAWCKQTFVVNSTQQTLRWKQYANNSANEWAVSEEFSYTTLPAFCDDVIAVLPYNITKNNTYYCLATSSTNLAGNGIQFGQTSLVIQNSTLDCLGRNLDGDDSGTDYGIQSTISGNKNNTIKNCNITDFYTGIYLTTGTSNHNITNNTVNSNTYTGIYFWYSQSNTIDNNTANGNTNYGIYLASSTNNNILTNNRVNNNGDRGIYFWDSSNNILTNNTFNSNTNYGIYLDSISSNNILTNNTVHGNSAGIYPSGSNNSVTGGSIALSSTYDYYLLSSGATNNFTNTNFTAARTIYLDGGWFNYNNETTGNIWLKTNAVTVTITRKLINWNNTLIRWNDTNSSGAGITATYNITGLNANTEYKIYNNSVLAYTLTTGSNGELNFTIALTSGGNNISVEVSVTVNRWLEVNWTSGSQINSTCSAGSPCQFNQYSIFNANATVKCRTNPSGYSCGNVNGSMRYNSSSSTITSIKANDSSTQSYKGGNTTPGNPPPSLTVGSELSSDDYTKVGSSNDVWASYTSSTNAIPLFRADYTIPAYNSLNWVFLSWEGSLNSLAEYLYVWNFTSSAWVMKASNPSCGGADCVITYNITSSSELSNFVQNNHVHILLYGDGLWTTVFIDYAYMNVSYTPMALVNTTKGAKPFYILGNETSTLYVYNFSGITSPSTTHKAEKGVTYPCPTTIPSGTEATTTQYGYINSANNVDWEISGTNDCSWQTFKFIIAEAPSSITKLNVFWRGTGNNTYTDFTPCDSVGYGGDLYIWNFASSSWTWVGTHVSVPNDNITGSYTSGIANYVNASGYLYLKAEMSSDSACTPPYPYIDTDFVYVNVTVTSSSATNIQSCGSLSDGQQCQLNWTVNATGDTLPLLHVLDVNFTSSLSSAQENKTNNSYVRIGGADSIPPTYSLNSTNSTLAGLPIEFRLRWTDNTVLHPKGQYQMWLDNCTGSFQNITPLTNFTSTPQWVNVTATINSTVGCMIRWFQNGTDDAGNINNTGLTSPFSFIATYEIVSQNQGANATTIKLGDTILLYTYWKSKVFDLSHAILATNETGAWQNKSSLALTGKEAWSNFTWSSTAITTRSAISWKIYANDTSNNQNVSDTRTFVVDPRIIITIDSSKMNANRQIVAKPNSAITVYGKAFYASDNSAVAGLVIASRYDSTSLGSNTTDSQGDYYLAFQISRDGVYALSLSGSDVYGNSGLNTTSMIIRAKPISVKYSLSYRLGADKANDVYRIPTTPVTNSTIDELNTVQVEYPSGLKHAYVCSYDKTEYSAGMLLSFIHSGTLSNLNFVNFSASTGIANYTLQLKQRIEDSQLIIPFTKGTCQLIDDKMYLVEKQTIPANTFATFAYGTMTEVPVQILLRWNKIRLNGSDSFTTGSHKVCIIKSAISSDYKPIITVEKC